MDLDKFPTVPLALLEALEAKCPEFHPTVGDSQDYLMWHGGRRDLVRWLRSVFTAQQEPRDTPDEGVEFDHV